MAQRGHNKIVVGGLETVPFTERRTLQKPPPQQQQRIPDYTKPVPAEARVQVEYVEEPPPPKIATVLEADTGLMNSKSKLCALVLIFMICAFGLITFLIAFTGGRHKPHGAMQQELTPVVSAVEKANVYQIENSNQILTELTTYYYNIFLSEEIQQWQIFPDKDSCLPLVNMSNAKLASFDVCCFSDKDTWICSNGHTFDSYSFEARLKSTDIQLGGVQCHIYINSRHLAKSQCTIEVKVMK